MITGQGCQGGTFLEQRRDHRIESAQERMGRHRPLRAKVAELTAILHGDGCLASYVQLADGHVVLVEHHCASAAVANRYGQDRTSEIGFIRAVLPEADIMSISHIVNGDRRGAPDVVRKRGRAGVTDRRPERRSPDR